MARLSVNLNKIALLRNSRHTGVPDVLKFAGIIANRPFSIGALACLEANEFWLARRSPLDASKIRICA